MEVTVRVPASSANLGPGFDTLGLALALYNRLSVAARPGPPGEVRITIQGEGEGHLETGPENLAYRSMQRLARVVGRVLPALDLRLANAIPVSRGLGSSSSAIVGGLVAANALFGSPLDPHALLQLAAEIEGHPDNVAPALLGGLQVSAMAGGEVIHLTVPVPRTLKAVVCIPSVAVSTEAARGALPPHYSRADTVFNSSRAALLVASLATGRLQHLARAMEDRVHQPYRASLIPGFDAALQAALDAGALGACLSGSGSTLLALTANDDGAIGRSMVAAVQAGGAEARWLSLEIDSVGARCEAVTGA
jgi:homoserine kinase